MTETHFFNTLHYQELKLINFYLRVPLGTLDEPPLTLRTPLHFVAKLLIYVQNKNL